MPKYRSPSAGKSGSSTIARAAGTHTAASPCKINHQTCLSSPRYLAASAHRCFWLTLPAPHHTSAQLLWIGLEGARQLVRCGSGRGRRSVNEPTWLHDPNRQLPVQVVQFSCQLLVYLKISSAPRYTMCHPPHTIDFIMVLLQNEE